MQAGLVAAGMPGWKARIYHGAVRLGGGPDWRVKGVSWAFGGEYFRYSARPAEPEDEP